MSFVEHFDIIFQIKKSNYFTAHAQIIIHQISHMPTSYTLNFRDPMDERAPVQFLSFDICLPNAEDSSTHYYWRSYYRCIVYDIRILAWLLAQRIFISMNNLKIENWCLFRLIIVYEAKKNYNILIDFDWFRLVVLAFRKNCGRSAQNQQITATHMYTYVQWAPIQPC